MRAAATAREASAPESPELRPWVDLCEEVRRALGDPPWGSVTRGPAPLADGAPLLADAILSVDVGRAASTARPHSVRKADTSSWSRLSVICSASR